MGDFVFSNRFTDKVRENFDIEMRRNINEVS